MTVQDLSFYCYFSIVWESLNSVLIKNIFIFLSFSICFKKMQGLKSVNISISITPALKPGLNDAKNQASALNYQ